MKQLTILTPKQMKTAYIPKKVSNKIQRRHNKTLQEISKERIEPSTEETEELDTSCGS